MPRREENSWKGDVPLDVWSHVRVWTFCGGLLGVLFGLAEDPTWVETRFVDGFGVQLAGWLSWLSSPIPLSIAEVVVALLVVIEVLRFLEAVAKVGGMRRRWHNALLGGLLHAADLAFFLGAWFYVSWGLAYARPPAAERFGLDPAPVEQRLASGDLSVLYQDADRLVRRVNAAYVDVHGRQDVGSVTVPRNGLDVDAALEQAFARLATIEGLPASFAAPRGPAKRPFASVLLSYLGVGGIYVPFTGEATVNADPPAWSLVMTAAHEKAHQRMVASEDEASFVGFLACVYSEEPLLRYAAWQFARRQVMSTLVRADADALTKVGGRLAEGPQRDVIALSEYWANFEGPLQSVHEFTNDVYLRFNEVEGGVQSYGRAALLVSAWLHGPTGRRLLDDPKAKVK